MKIYIASPFFNEIQLKFVKNIENKLKESNIDFFSPRLEGGILKDMTKDEREKISNEIYKSNINGIINSDGMIAVIDNFDPGTMFEIGYIAALKDDQFPGPLITISQHGYGLNVMLAECSNHHAKNIDDAIEKFCEYINTGKIKNPNKGMAIT